MARSFSYQDTNEGGIQFVTKRRIGDVRIPNYVYDMWMPVIGSDAIGVYAVYCRLEMKGAVKKMTLARLAASCRIGVKKLNSINDKLEKCGFIRVSKPTGKARLMHWTTKIEVYDPPQEISKELIDEFCNGDYDLLTPWFKDENPTSSEKSKGNSDEAKGTLDTEPKDNSNIASLDLHPLKDASPPKKTDFLDHFFSFNGKTSESTASNPDDQWIEYGNRFIQLFNDRLKRYPKPPEKDAIASLSIRDDANPDIWLEALDLAVNKHPRGSPNLDRCIELYEELLKGGDWNSFARRKWGDDSKPTHDARPKDGKPGFFA